MKEEKGPPDQAASPRRTTSSAADGAAPPSDSAASEPGQVFYCDLCGNVMLNLHCKLICERCGYKRDCSDP